MNINLFTSFIKNDTPFIFAKFGDGEYLAARGGEGNGGNCDGTPYTPKLSEGVINSFKYLTGQQNVYIARWVHNGVDAYFQSLTENQIMWTDYNIFIFKSIDQYFSEQAEFYSAIRNSKRQKIYICNSTMTDRSKHLLNIDNHVIVDSVNWFENNYDEVLKSVISVVKDPNNVMILSSAGMGAKVLIADLHKLFSKAFIIDIGSAMDLVFGGRRSRDFHYNFSDYQVDFIRKSLAT
jgi:hypothetical protein